MIKAYRCWDKRSKNKKPPLAGHLKPVGATSREQAGHVQSTEALPMGNLPHRKKLLQ
jgi:hypothetical protein